MNIVNSLGRRDRPSAPVGPLRRSRTPTKHSNRGRLLTERNGSRPSGAGLGCVGSFSRPKKCRVRKSAWVESSPRREWQQRNGGFPLHGVTPGNGQVVDPATTHTSRSLIRRQNCRYKLLTGTPTVRPFSLRPLISRAFLSPPTCLVGRECVLRIGCDSEHNHCPKCRRWTCVVVLKDGTLYCNRCKYGWSIGRATGSSPLPHEWRKDEK